MVRIKSALSAILSVAFLIFPSQSYSQKPALLALQPFDESTIYVAGERATFMKTSDGGRTWETIQIKTVESSVAIQAIYFKDRQTGWAVGHRSGFVYYGYILRTLDAGRTWEVQFGGLSDGNSPGANYPFYDLTFKNSQEGWAVGQGDFRTSDGGSMWQGPYDFYYGRGYDDIIRKIQFLDQDNAWLVTQRYLYRSFNGGRGWTRLSLPSLPFSISFVSGFFVDAQAGFAVGNLSGGAGGVILRVSDSGRTVDYQLLSAQPASVWFTDPLRGVAVGDSIYRTADGGKTWAKIAMPEGVKFLNAVRFLNRDVGFAVSREGEVIATLDGGQSWTRTPAPAAAVFTSVSSASFARGAPLAAEVIAAGFGAGLARGTGAATTVPLPSELLGTSVQVTDSQGMTRPAPLFFVSPTQINYLIPAGTSLGTARVAVTSGAGGTVTGSVELDRVAPSLYTANAQGTGVAAAFHLRVAGDGTRSQDFIFNPSTLASVPIDLGPQADQVFLLLFGTGIRGFASGVAATVGGQSVPVLGALPQGQFVGLDQVNIGPLPRSLAGRGEVDVILTADGKAANTVRVNIR